MSAGIYTPLHLELMIHYHGSNACFPRENSCVIEYRENLIKAALLEPDNTIQAKFKITKKGECFVEMLCATPLPIMKYFWADPRT